MKHVLLPPPSKKFAVRGVFTCALACLMMLISSSVFAQSQTISGTVTDATTNSPLAGAAIMVKGTTVGTISDADGSYRINAKPTDVLVCTFFGYKSQEVTVGNRSAVNFAIQEDNTQIDEVVVVGYGTLKKTQLVGAVENLDGEEIASRTNASITRSLQGQIPGLNIIQSDGKPNHSGAVYIRGGATSYQTRSSTSSSENSTKSIGQGGSALVLIDGVEGDLSSVNPEDIETISVLKDAASSAVYGARAAFGVILVTTKEAKKDRVTVNYSGSVSLNRRTVIWEDHLVSDGLVWAENFAEYFQGDARTPQSSGVFPSDVNKEIGFSQAYLEEFHRRREDPSYENYGKLYGNLKDLGGADKTVYYGSTDWVGLYLKDYNFTQTHNLTISGGSEKTNFSVSGRYYNQDGIYNLGNEDFKQYNLRAKGSVKLGKMFTLANNTSMYKRKYHQPFVVNGSMPIWRQIEHRAQPIYPVYNEDGTLTYAAASMVYEGWSEDQAYQEENTLDIATTTTLTFEPIKDVLKFTGDFTYKGTRYTKDRLSPVQTGYTTPGIPHEYNTTSYKSNWRQNTDYVASNIVGTWTPKLGENHSLNVVAGWNIEKKNYRNMYLQLRNLLYPSQPSFELTDSGEYYSVTDSGWDKTMVGVFARVNYTLLNRYIFEFAGRYDGSSLFPSNQRWGFFPSGSIGWRVSEEPWMKWSRDWLDNFKIRANVGSLGNASIGAYQFLNLWNVDKTENIVIDGIKPNKTQTDGLVPESLTWETVTTYDIGVDFDVLRNRLSGSFDYYWRYTNDLLITGPDYPEILGESSPKGNYGSLKTKGWEASLAWRDSFKLGGKPFNYNVKVSVWDSRTWVKDFYNIDGNIYNYYDGKELGEIWGFRTDGYFLTNEEANNWAQDTFHKNGNNFRAYAGDLKFLDLNGDGKIGVGKGTLDDPGDLERIGNSMPRYQYGINLGANWNGIGLSVFIQGVGKRDWYPRTESGFFWGMYNRPYGYLPEVHTTDAVIMDYSTENWRVTNPGAYYTRKVAYAANRNVGPLTYENDYYLQDASYWRIKNITVDYTFPQELTRKIRIERLKIYVSGENIFTHSPIFKHTKMFDPEVIGTGDSDYNTTTGGLSGVGEGYSYPMLKTWTIGLNVTF